MSGAHSLGAWADLAHLDELGRRDSPLHRLDARAKILAALVFIVLVMSFPRYEIAALMPFALFPAVLLTVGRLPARRLLRQVLYAAPFALAVALCNPVFDRQPVALGGGPTIAAGWLSFASIMVRFGLTVSVALALVACTGVHRLCAGLVQLGLPRVFAVQVLFLYRYLFVIAAEAGRLRRSLELRAAGRRALRLRVYGALVGHLLLRSLDRAQRVYRAMLARGFAGEVRLLTRPTLAWRDVAFCAGWIAFFAAARAWDLAAGLGRLLTAGAA